MVLELGVGPISELEKEKRIACVGKWWSGWKVEKGMIGRLHSARCSQQPTSALVADMASILDWLLDRW